MDIIKRSILFLVFLISTQNYFILSLGTMNIICKPSERTALLSFKQHLNDPFNRNSLSSWSSENCCRWAGVVCSNITHHVIQLQLQKLGLGGELNPSLQELKQLRHLDLSLNDFDGISIPGFLGSLQSLRYLDLSRANFSGMIPHQLGNLSNLRYLDLSSTYRTYGSLSGVLPTSLSHVTSLEVLVLSFNDFNSTLPEWLYSLTNLQRLDLKYNHFQGTISPSICNLTKLTLLDLSVNQLSGRLPDELGRLSLLEMLDLTYNKLNGSLPESLGNLSKLGKLDITNNAFEGIVSEVHLANLTNLQYLYMNSPSLVLKVSPGWVPPFQLYFANFQTCQLGPGFPVWLRTQKNLAYLDLSRTGISGTIPTWFWNLTSQNLETSVFDLSYNELHGELPKVINATSAISLKSNQFSGQLPRVITNIIELDLSNNSFSGPISTLLCNPPPPASGNNNLGVLDLSNNLLSGNLSDCWVNWTSLRSLRLGENKITGKIPSSMGYLQSLQALQLSNNNLSGELPSSLRNCTSLMSIDLGENGFTGRLPIWLGESLSDLQYLQLRSNKFYGEIPLELCHLASIQVLDIAHNNLRGSIPRCFKNFSPLRLKEQSYYRVNSFGKSTEKTQLVVKGREVVYYRMARGLVTSLDLSKNSLSGEIPEELTSLLRLISLNLSWNGFTGRIPEKIGNMSSLESLDFSNNNISGVIPQSISGLSFLSVLNLSYNNLSGIIPSSTQLQGFSELSFIGNQELCGPPLNKCNGEEPTQKPGDGDIGDRADEDEDWFEMKWFYMSMGVGFVFGFWVFCGVLVFKKSWRFAYFRFLDDMKDKICLLF